MQRFKLSNQNAVNLGKRLKSMRSHLGLSQEAVGAQGFVSTPGWIKIENGQRLPSDPLISDLTRWLVSDGYLSSGLSERLREELLTLKYLSHSSEFVRALAKAHLGHLRPSGILHSDGAPARSNSRKSAKKRPSVRRGSRKKSSTALVARKRSARKVSSKKSSKR